MQLEHGDRTCVEAYSGATDSAAQAAPSGGHPGRAALGVPHVAIACTLRSGSNLFCEMLRVNGFGNPKEWFQIGGAYPTAAFEPPRVANLRLLESQTAQFLLEHAQPGWRGVKCEWRQWQRLRRLAPMLPEAASILQAFQAGTWFLLLRRDLAAQAVSLYAARQTNVWMGEDTTEYRRLAKDFDGIYERFAELAADCFAWENYFSDLPHPPMRLFYEDLASGDPGIWLRVMRHLDPGFDAGRLDLEPLQSRPREHGRIRDLKFWFRNQILAGRQPHPVPWLLAEIGRTVARVEGQVSADGLLGRLTADLKGSPRSFRIQKLDLRKDLALTGAASVVQGTEFVDRAALRLDEFATCSFAVEALTRVLFQFHAHSWSGIVEISLGDRKEDIDLYTERGDSRYIFRDFATVFSGTIVVRCTGARNMLSKGPEVWLHRVLLLSAGS